MNKIGLVCLLFFTTSNLLFGQLIQRYSVSSSSGSTSTIGGYSIESNVGELMVETYSSSQYFFTQGFIQSDQFVLTIDNEVGSNIRLIAYPNPVTTFMNVSISAPITSEIVVEIYNSLGELLNFPNTDSSWNTNSTLLFDLSSISSGVYFIKARSLDGVYSYNFKFNKI